MFSKSSASYSASSAYVIYNLESFGKFHSANLEQYDGKNHLVIKFDAGKHYINIRISDELSETVFCAIQESKEIISNIYPNKINSFSHGQKYDIMNQIDIHINWKNT